MRKSNAVYTVRKSGDNYQLYFRGRMAECGLFADRKTAEKYARIGEVEYRDRMTRKAEVTRDV